MRSESLPYYPYNFITGKIAVPVRRGRLFEIAFLLSSVVLP